MKKKIEVTAENCQSISRCGGSDIKNNEKKFICSKNKIKLAAKKKKWNENFMKINLLDCEINFVLCMWKIKGGEKVKQILKK